MVNIVFDLDGTLADISHRVHHLQGPTNNWDAFFSAPARDRPIITIMDVFRTMQMVGHHVEVWTARSEGVGMIGRRQARLWLRDYGLYPARMRMRKVGDERKDHLLKRRWLRAVRMYDRRRIPDLVFEDRSRVVAMWREEGISCCQVADGDF